MDHAWLGKIVCSRPIYSSPVSTLSPPFLSQFLSLFVWQSFEVSSDISVILIILCINLLLFHFLFFFPYTQHYTIFSWILSGKHQILPSLLLLSLWHKETYWCPSSSSLQRKMYRSEPLLQWLSLILLVFLVPHLLGFTVHQQ